MEIPGNGGKKAVVFLMVAMVGVSMIAPAVMAAPSDELSYDGDTQAPNPYFDVDSLTVASHPMDKGTSATAMAGYYDDNGDWVADPIFTVNTTADNPYSFKPGHVQDPQYGAFPRNSEASAIDASEWSKSGTNSGEVTLSDTSVAQNVEAARINTGSSFTSGDAATITYNNWTSQLDSDESKRVLQIGADIDTLDSGTQVQVIITDETGDTKTVYIDSAKNANNDNVIANSTGDVVHQVKLSKLSTTGGGSWDNIESIDVKITDGDFDGSFSWIDLAKKGKTTLGAEKVDTDGDDELETQTIYTSSGTISVYSMDTLGGDYDDATINDVSFPAHFPVSQVEGSEGDEGAYIASFSSADQYPGFDSILSVDYRMHLPDAIDLSYSGVDLMMEQTLPENRYNSAGYVEDVSENANLSDVSKTSFANSLGEVGTEVTIDSTVSIGTYYVVGADVLLTADEKSNMMASGGGAAPPGGSGGGIVGFIMTLPGMLLSVAAGILGFKWLKG